MNIYNLCFLRIDEDQDIEGWVRLAGVPAFILGAGPGWVMVVFEMKSAVIPDGLVESNTGMLLHNRYDSRTGWSFEIYEACQKVCSFSADWSSEKFVLDTSEVDMSVLERLAGLSHLDFAYSDSEWCFELFGERRRLLLKTLSVLLQHSGAWLSYVGKERPDELFAEALGLYCVGEIGDFDGITFDALMSHYLEQPDIFEEMYPGSKLIAPDF